MFLSLVKTNSIIRMSVTQSIMVKTVALKTMSNFCMSLFGRSEYLNRCSILLCRNCGGNERNLMGNTQIMIEKLVFLHFVSKKGREYAFFRKENK